MDSAVTCNEEEMEAEEKHNSEEEIEFVSEGQLRPVLECVDLLSSDDETQALTVNRTIKDHIDCQKDRVASTLERLARHVEKSKQQKAEKNRAFQEKLNFQHAHGLQELEFIKDVPGKQAAKMCVKEWLNMPGLRPGCVSASRRNFSTSRESISVRSQSITCPVMKCNRKFDNGQLLLGHLKRFDHSPCDPTIALHGVCDHSTYACVLCLKRFGSMKEYNDHFSAKVHLTDGHERHIPPLPIQCFACPSCFVLFYQRDECLKHMSARNHFRRTIVFKDQKDAPCPVPMPAYAKNVLIALCKDILFQIVCTSCRLELRSYTELTAHFRTRCRNAGPVSLSDKSIVDVAAVFRLEAYCPYCKLALSTDSHIVKHTAKTSHKIRRIASIEESILVFCYINEGTKTPSDICLSAANDRLKPCTLKRTLHNDISSNILQKCKKESKMATIHDWRVKTEQDVLIKAWFCECLQQFPSEKAAEKHIMTANRIFHRCMVCGKLAEDLGIIHLHMSRFHGGAHLSNFRFWCQICLLELVRVENVMAHVSDIHGGHSFYYEDDVLEQPSTSTEAKTPMLLEADISAVPHQASKGMWQCHICEEMFDSEETVKQHCKSLTIHQFHKYSCDTCKKKFHKLETLLRHCQNQHDGDIKTKFFCGLCEDLYLDEEKDFLAHYESFHGLDYGFVPNRIQSPSKMPEVTSSSSTGTENHLTCGCLAKYTDKAKRKEDSNLCLAKLFEKGKLWYSCTSCSATDQTIEGIRRHLCKKGTEQISSDFVVKCSICSKSFHEAEHAQHHYHTKHCFLEKPYINRIPCGSKNEVFKFTAGGSRVSKQMEMEKAHTKKLHYEALGRPKNMSGSPSVKTEVESMDIGLRDTAHAETSSGMSLVMPEPFSTSTFAKTENKEVDIQPMDADFEESDLPDLEFLQTMTHIVFVDLDNWAQFFTHLPGQLNQGTFVWGFQGGKNVWKPPITCKIYKYLSNTGCFFLHPRCSNRKDAADFAICMHAGRLDEKLPKQIPFTILSGDKGFLELENQFKKTQRPAHILNPHHLGGDMMCALLNSIAETTQDSDDTEISTVQQEEEANFEEAIRRSLVEM